MNTSQLLLVSSLGLGVNLFGMFAMGGHHHHVGPHPSIPHIAYSGAHLFRAVIRIHTGMVTATGP